MWVIYFLISKRDSSFEKGWQLELLHVINSCVSTRDTLEKNVFLNNPLCSESKLFLCVAIKNLLKFATVKMGVTKYLSFISKYVNGELIWLGRKEMSSAL